MSKYLCTFPGKFGDILWSLATVKFIAEKIVGEPVDFAVMPYYESILPLIQKQEYIDRAFAIKTWLKTHSNYGDQPWEAPVNTSYERVWHLGYRCHPGKAFGNVEMALIDFIAYQQGITFPEPQTRFLDTRVAYSGSTVAVACNELYVDQKKEFRRAFADNLIGAAVVDVDDMSWVDAAIYIRSSIFFVGDRSANWVIAQGLGKECITYEPHPARHAIGYLGKVFGNPYGREVALPLLLPARVAGETAAAMVKKRIAEKLEVAAT